MYDYLCGRLVERGADEAVVEVGGIGYRLAISAATAAQLPAVGTGEVTLFAHDVLRDERLLLYGFASRTERALFLKLLTVSRIGPSIALALLSAIEPAVLASAVRSGDVAALAAVRGVGRRTAERLCVELKDRLDEFAVLPGTVPGALTDRRTALASALVALGYPRSIARTRADTVCAAAPAELPIEGLVRLALRELSSAAEHTE
ncbi:MAG: Holliday junction branch migration protein RuvA [Planctomycetota bacterium]